MEQDENTRDKIAAAPQERTRDPEREWEEFARAEGNPDPIQARRVAPHSKKGPGADDGDTNRP